MTTKELCTKIKYLVGKHKTLSEICTILNLKDYEVVGLVDFMRQDGELIDFVNGEIVRLKKPPKVDDVYKVDSFSTHIPL